MAELKLEKGMAIAFPNGKEDLMNFKITVSPDDGIYRGGSFVFDFKVPKTYPHDAPKVLCETTVFHPNIDMEGHVCLNILREDWKPVLTIQSVSMGLQFLMLEPNADDPLNKEVHAPSLRVWVARPLHRTSLANHFTRQSRMTAAVALLSLPPSPIIHSLLV